MLTDQGLSVKTFRQIQTEIQQTLDDANLNVSITDDANVVASNLFNPLILALTELHQLQHNLYNSFNIYTASGQALDRLVVLKRLQRLEPSKSKGNLQLNCKGRGVVNTNFIVSDERNRLVTVSKRTTVGYTSFSSADIKIGTVVTGTSYYIIINGVSYQYTAVVSDTEVEVLTQLKTLIEAGEDITVTVDGDVITLTNQVVENFNLVLQQNLSVDTYSVLLEAEATVEGNVVISANELVNIKTPLPFITSVNNPEDFVSGQSAETDEELRNRFLASTGVIGQSTPDSIRNNILLVEGVASCLIVNNPTDTVVDGVPPHAFEPIVSGGDPADIGLAILQSAPAGIQSFGDVITNPIDMGGTSHIIGFSRPEEVFIWVKVEYEQDTSTPIAADVDTLIKEKIVEYSRQLVTGNPIIPSKFTVPIYDLQGIGEVIVSMGTSVLESALAPDTGYSQDRITPTTRQVAVFDTSKVVTSEVTIP